ncbi:hypothetical protein [Spirulina sp. 06S082]|uniref:hypothetical protein n=1 Tax=Spirulina sp. 06S082 TaxID=3110248 RepID=UPI002B1F153A|nr:hypothetical protein [Spirulina sp. 06S082]MEA5472404.1 hypothetical protein [Spirulina sp. 06S082]
MKSSLSLEGKMNTEKVISREYKIMLKAEKFQGETAIFLAASALFWQNFKTNISEIVPEIKGNLDRIEKNRLIKFYDTKEKLLRTNNYVFRERIDIDENSQEVTLKFRHPDRYISQDRNMDARKKNKGTTKFEEDIKPDFLKLYSFSTKQKVSETKTLQTLNDISNLYPDIENKIPEFKKDREIVLVGDFVARETVITNAQFTIRKSPLVKADCALVVWRDREINPHIPLLVEFSFKYEDEKEEYTYKMAQRAYDVFQALQKMEDWIDPNSMTKTAYVYHLDS